MTHALRALGRGALDGLADALRSGRLALPVGRTALAHHVPDEHLDAVCAALNGMAADGMAGRHVATAIALLVEERASVQDAADRVELVCSPPELDRVDARDTVVVIQELFRRARSSLVIATFALDERRKAEVLFGELAARMDAEPALDVRIYANIHRERDDARPNNVLVRLFSDRMRDQVWPGKRLPEVYYDPRSLEVGGKRAVLHAKAVVADRRWSVLTSANLTEAAHERNIEMGALIDDPHVADRVVRQFERLVEQRILRTLRPG